MKIAIFSDNFYPELSGVSDSIITTAKELAERGHQITFYVPKYSEKDYLKGKLPYQESDLGVGIKIVRFSSISFRSGTGQSRAVLPSFWRWFAVKKNKPDIIWSQFPMGMGLEALIASRMLKVPLVGTNHTAITEFMKYFPVRAGWIDKAALGYFSWYYNRCVFVSAPSGSVFEEMIPNGFKQPHKIISNPVGAQFYSDSSVTENTDVRPAFKWSKNTVLTVGRLAIEKSTDVIIRAIAIVKKEIPDITLAIVGFGSDEDRLRKITEELGLNDNVSFMDGLYKEKLAQAYDACDVYVTASTSETQGMTVLQAMASRKPVVGARARALPEYINDKNGILFEPGNYEELASAIISLLGDSERRRRLGDGGFESVRDYSPEKITDKWEEIFKKIIDKI